MNKVFSFNELNSALSGFFQVLASLRRVVQVMGKVLFAMRPAEMGGVLVSLLLIPSVWAAAPSSSASDVSGYEIPLGELKKVKKDRPVKKERKERKKKKGESAVNQSSIDLVKPSEKVDQSPAAATGEPSRDVLPAFRQQTASENTGGVISNKTEIIQTSTGPVTIHHDPNSYVITGKRTIVQSVISSTDGIQAVYCRFRAGDHGSYAIVPMVQAPGTLFTYRTTLPSLAAASQSLRYTIIAIDSMGNETRSREFVIAVKPSVVLPGWQLDSSLDVIKIKFENRVKPLEGFSDQGIVVE